MEEQTKYGMVVNGDDLVETKLDKLLIPEPEQYYSRVRDVKPIERGTSEASGLDLFVPKFNEEFLNDLIQKNPCISQIKPDNFEYVIDKVNNRILLAPHAKLMIPSGIKLRGRKYVSVHAFNKSGIGTKKGLNRLAEVVDSDYQGEVHISISNTTPFIIAIKEDEKLIQFVQLHIALDKPFEVDENELFIDESERGEGGFGSTNK